MAGFQVTIHGRFWVTAEDEIAIQQTDERIKTLVDVSMSLAHNLQTLGEETDRRIKETQQSIRELRESQATTDYKLNALIETVDKLVRRNGNPK